MKYNQWRSKISVLTLVQIVLLLVAVALPVVQSRLSVPLQWDSDLRQLEVQSLQLTSALNILKDHRHVVQAINDGAETVDSITLSLIETIKRQAHAQQHELTQLTVNQSEDREIAFETKESTLHALTVKFAVTMDRAMGLVPLFDALTEAAGWRPVEIRGCSIVRLKVAVVSLHATCSVDVYYFPEIDK